MTTRTEHRTPLPTAVRLFEASTEQGTTHLWSRCADDARWTVWSHDLIDGLVSYDDFGVEEVSIGRPDYAACAATADEHVRCGFASLDLRRRLRAFAARLGLAIHPCICRVGPDRYLASVVLDDREAAFLGVLPRMGLAITPAGCVLTYDVAVAGGAAERRMASEPATDRARAEGYRLALECPAAVAADLAAVGVERDAA